uniref:Aminopeptidase n=1 Tax=Petromyzon marinus TaxID=7757 RepID=A0AAJ7T1X2_PETMA|nr:aminopeptidase Ey-like [Petromyzon marinus]
MGKEIYISKTKAIVIALAVAVALVVVGLMAGLIGKDSVSSDPKTTSKPLTTKPSTTTAPPYPPGPWNEYRLPRSVIPTHYEVELKPELYKQPDGLYIFSGQVNITMICKEQTDVILIHSNKLNYSDNDNISLSGQNGPMAVNTWLATKTEYLVVQLTGAKLEKDMEYVLHAKFRGELADDLAGLYRSEYTENNETKIMATSQMEPTDARKTFPCFDEPDMKATFDITLIHKAEHVALSNMPVVSTSIEEDWVHTKFNTSVVMPTYLLAFIISDFEKVEAVANKTLIRIWAKKTEIAAGNAEYALNITGKILNFFEEYYDVPYVLPKSDQIAIPDFAAGAMENWGLVTYRETALLYNPDVSSNGNKESVATIVTHELAHQWFGNLVTMRWWSELWLNEGFASYLEYIGTHEVEPSWNIKALIILNDLQRAMSVDALASSRPLSVPHSEVMTPAQANSMFDTISYSKGACILSMTSSFLTEPVFVAGLKAVDNHTVTLPVAVKDILDRWTIQMGYPVVHVNTSSGKLTQSHFLLNPNSTVTRPSEFDYVWYIPITWKTSTNVSAIKWLNEQEEVFSDLVHPTSWVILNVEAMGYYRVHYDDGNFQHLLDQLNLNHSAIPLQNRAQLIDDTFSLATAAKVAIEKALETTVYLENEDEYVPWRTALNNLGYINEMFSTSKYYGRTCHDVKVLPSKCLQRLFVMSSVVFSLQKYMLKQIENVYQIHKNLSFVPSGHMDQYMQVYALNTACGYGKRECLESALTIFQKWMENKSSNVIHPNLRSVVYCQALAAGSILEWDFAFKLFQETTFPVEKEKLRSALACSTEPWILRRLLEYALDSTFIRKQDATSVITSVARNVIGRPLAWSFVKEKWDFIFNQYGSGFFSFSNLITGVTRHFSTQAELGELLQFKVTHPNLGSAAATMEQAIERTRTNIQWRDQNEERINSWFESKVNPNVIYY